MNSVALRNHLDLLLDDANRNRAEEAAESWAGLSQYVDNNCQLGEDFALTASVLLAKDDSLLDFLAKSLEQQGKAGSKVREAILKYLETFLTRLGPDKAYSHCKNVIDSCLFAFKREESNPAKGATLLPLQCILHWGLSVPDIQTVSELAKAYQNAYQRVKTLTGTVKGDILQTIGLLLDAQAPDQQVGVDHAWLLNECMLVLQNQAKASKPDQGYMAGALAGLSSALTQCKDGEGVEAQETAYQHIRKSIHTVQTLSRYHGLRAALDMLSFQADKFQDHLVEDAMDIINTLLHLKTQHANKDVRDRADQALSAVFHQLAQRMAAEEGPALPRLQALHKKLLGQLTNILSSSVTSSRERIVAVAGIGELAAPTRRFFGQQGVTQLLQHLTPLIQQGNLVEQLEDVVDDKITNEVTLLGAMAMLLAESSSVDESVVQQGLHVVGRIVQAYRGLWPKQRGPVHAALNSYLMALTPKQVVLQSMLPKFVGILMTHTLKPAEDNLVAGPLAVAASQREDVEQPWQTYLNLWQALLQPEPASAAADKSSKATNSTISSSSSSKGSVTAVKSSRRSSSKAAGLRLGQQSSRGGNASHEQWALQQQAVYDALLRAVLDVLRNLDLGYQQADSSSAQDASVKFNSPDAKSVTRQGEPSVADSVDADIGTGLVAHSLTDMRTFISLADFVCGILPKCGADRFQNWAHLATLDLVAGSGQRPLLSGFYRMLTVTMKLTNAATPRQGSFEQEAHQVCLEVYRDKLQGVVIASRRYKDELLEACLEMMLSAPTTVMTINELVGPLQTAFALGLQYPPLATAAVAALERWETEQTEALRAVCSQIVPLLEPYLHDISDASTVPDQDAAEGVTVDVAADDDGDGEETALRGEAGGKDAYKRVQASSVAAVQRQQAARLQGLRSVQPRLQAWLGRAAAASDALVVQTTNKNSATSADASATSTAGGNRARWGPDNKLGLPLPSPQDEGLVLWLDKMLPQAAELAERAADRTTRVAACEFLHAVTLWMIGENARRPEGSREANYDAPPTQFHAIMRKLFPVLLSLACAAESVARQLFEPLVMSLVHWLTRAARRESAETIVLLEAILDGLSDERSGAKRDLCATAAKEFLVWSAKHIALPKPSETGALAASASNNLNAASLLRRLFERLTHPEAYQRLGAAQAMAKCADAMGRLSDLNDVSDAFYLEAVSKCVLALRVAEHDAEGSGTKSQLADAIGALVKVPLRRAHLADSIRHSRKDRPGFTDLAALLAWLWPFTAVNERYCRQVCMWLLDKLATLQMADAMQTDESTSSGALWLEWHLEQNQLDRNQTLQQHLTVQVQLHSTGAEGAMSLTHLRLWIQAVEASISWAVWAIDQQIITPDQLSQLSSTSKRLTAKHGSKATGPADEDSQQGCMLAVEDFLSMLPPLSGSEAPDGASHMLVGCENDTKHLAFKVLALLQQVVETESFPEDLPALHNFLLTALLAPSHLGIPAADVHSARRLAIEAQAVIQLAASAEPGMLKPLQQGIATYLSAVTGTEGFNGNENGHRLLVSKGNEWEWGLDLSAAATFLQGLTLAADTSLPDGLSLIPASFKSDLPHRLLSLAASTRQGAPPQQHLAAQGALNLALRLGLPHADVMDRLVGPNSNEGFYKAYSPVIHTWVIFNAPACAGGLLEAVARRQGPPQHGGLPEAGAGPQGSSQRVAQDILIGCLDSLQRAKNLQGGKPDIRQRSFLGAILPHIPQLQPLMQASINSKHGAADGSTTLLQLMGHLLSLDAEFVLRPSQAWFKFILDSYCSLLSLSSSAAAVVQMRVEALQLLHHFLKLPDDSAKQLTGSLQELANNVLPASSWELKRGTTQATDYARQLMAVMESTVVAAEQGHSVEPLLQAILPVLREMGQPKGHVRQDALVTRLALVAAAPWKPAAPQGLVHSTASMPAMPGTPQSPPQSGVITSSQQQSRQHERSQEQASSLFVYAWSQVFETPGLPSALRRAFLHYLLLPCLQYSPQSFQLTILQEHAGALLQRVDIATTASPHGLDDEAQLVARSAAYRLLQYIYQHMEPDVIKSHVLGPSGGEQVNAKILKAATNDIRTLSVSDPGLEQMGREARCAAFACGAALIVATQQKESFFAILLKDPKAADPSGPWKQLLDTSKELTFSVEAEEAQRSAFRRTSTSVRAVVERIRANRAGQFGASLAVSGSLAGGGSIGGFASQLPSLSSSSQHSLGDALMDGSQGGFTSSLDNVYQQSLSADADQAGDWQDGAETWLASQPEDSLAVEDDDLDRHTCMLPLVQLLEKAAALFQSTHTSSSAPQMPEWMKRMHTAVESSQVPKAVRLFLVKALLHVERRHADRQAALQQQQATSPGLLQAASVDTVPGVFGHFAGDWFPAMVSAVLGNAEEAPQQGIHYLLLDICLTCLNWHSLFPALFKDAGAKLTPQVKVAADALMDFLVRAAYNPQRQIVNNNFNLIKAFIHHWRAAVVLPLPALLSLLGATPPKPPSGPPDARAKRKAAEQRCVAMKLLAAGLMYGQSQPLMSSPDFKTALKHVLDCLATKGGQMLAQQSGECIGIILAQHHRKSKEGLAVQTGRTAEELDKEVKQVLLGVHSKGDHPRFIYSMERLTAFHKPLIEPLRAPLLSSLAQTTGMLQSLVLEILQRRAANLPNLVTEVKPVLPHLLASHNHALQNNALKLVKVLIRAESDESADQLLQQLTPSMADHSSSDCRQQYFETLRTAWQLRPAMHAVLRPALLAMLGDSNTGLRAEALGFWDSALPKHVGQRLQVLLQDSLTEPGNLKQKLEGQWAQSSAALLLELPKSQQTYAAAMFDRELAECKFAEYPIDTYGKPTLGMAPLFSSQWSASQEASQSQGTLSAFHPGSPGSGAAAGPRPTQAAAGMVRATVGASMSQSFSLALSLPREDQASAAFPGGGASSHSNTLSERAVVQRRFNRSAGARSQLFGRLQRRWAAAGASALARDRKVSLMRKYRTGELPDVQQLSVAAFLGPLGVMASRDASMAATAVEAFWCSATDAGSQDRQPSDLKQGLRRALRQCFEQRPRHAGYVKCLQSFALSDRGGDFGVGVGVQQAADAAQASGSLQAGALQIEQQMLFGEDEESAQGPPSKRRAVAGRAQGKSSGMSHPVQPSRRADSSCWSALASVYAELGQDDLVQIIYANCLSRCPGTEVAMQALTGRKVDLAFRVYQGLLRAAKGSYEAQPQAMDTDIQDGPENLNFVKLLGGQEPLKEEEDMWFHQQNRCMEALGMWEDVLSIVDDETREDESRLFVQKTDWDGTQYIRSFVRCCLFQPVENQRLHQLVQQASSDAGMTALLESHAPVEMAVQAAVQRQWDRCQALISRGWGVFRDKWGSLQPLSQARRFQVLALLQPLSELQEVVTLMHSLPPGTAGVKPLQETVAGWCQRWPSMHQPSADACLTLIQVRQLLLSALEQEWRQQQHGGQTMYQVMQGLRGDVLLGGAACLAGQGFLDTAQDLLTQHRADVGSQDLPSLQAQLRLRIHQVDASPGTLWVYKELSQEVKQIKQLQSGALASNSGARQQCQLTILQAEAYQRLAQQPNSTNRAYLKTALQKYEEAADGSKADKHQGSAGATAAAEASAEASLKLAFLCNELLQEQQGSDESASTRQRQGSGSAAARDQYGDLAAMMVQHMLHAMQMGGPSGKEAQLFVPRLLSVLADSATARHSWGQGWAQVPLYVLLPWVAQMLSLLDAAQGDALLPALQALAKGYPQQMYFPFKLSRQHYGPAGQGRAETLQSLLNSPLMEQWGGALNAITYPAQRWEGWMGRLSGLMAASDAAGARELYRHEAYPDMITNHAHRALGRASSRSPSATINSAFAAKWDAKFKEAFGATGDKISSMSARDLDAKCARLGQAIKQETDPVTGKRDLARLSHWFEAFSQRAGAAEQEQLVMPQMPNMHSSAPGSVPIKVAGFGKMVDVFSSKQRPKKLIIYGDDFKMYEWIVKGGEEVRIDQRIEQLFDVVNGLMQRQPGAAAHSLQVQTYDVVPISPSLGMVAFVGGTKPLKALLTDPALIPREAVAAADDKYARFILSKGGNLERPGPRYEKMFRAAEPKETIANLQAVQSLVRWDALREALMRAAGGPELFLSMRAVYTASLAAVSVAGYIAGVGDRHTDNFLVDLTSGALVPIDFGYSFGTAVQVLPIPELMPFRLTRQMIGALEPHDALALLQSPCTLALTALRSGKDILEGIMSVFMREPLLDWQREARVINAKRSAPTSARDSVSAAEAADPADMHVNLKVDNARRKLAGEHPAEIMLQELTAKHAKSAHWQALQAIVKGDKAHNFRSTVSGKMLSVEEQIRCLLDQATDPNILGRSWQGWKPWL